MTKKFNVPVALVVMLTGALPFSAAAQAPPRNHDLSSIWSSHNRALYELDVLTSRAFDESVPPRSSSLIIETSDPWSQDILTCEPQRSIPIDP